MEDLFKNYDEYVQFQKHRAGKTMGMTRKHIGRREWIYSQMVEHGVTGKNVLCVGARDKAEVEFFKEKGFKNIIGIDLLESDGVIGCDMSKMVHHPVLNRQLFDVVISIESIEHCLDRHGFVENLNVLCNGYFVCFCPVIEVPSQWDCASLPFMCGLKDNEDFKNKLGQYFDEFDIVAAEYVQKRKRLFFILKKNGDRILKKILPSSLKTVSNHSRSDFLSYLLEGAICAELGVYEGSLSSAILNDLSPKKFYAVDAYWIKFGENFWWDNVSTRSCYDKALERIKKADKNSCSELCVELDADFLNRFPDKHFDWIYLDTSHLFAETMEELDIICKKVKDEGYICGHDYISTKPLHIHFEVTRAISKWLQNNPGYELYLVDNHLQWIIRKKTL